MSGVLKGGLLSAALGVFAVGCALGRSQVKSLRDHQADRIQFGTVIPTTVTALNAVRSRCGITGDRRVREEEFHVYEIVGRITRVKREHDRDIHIVLQDPADPGEHMVVESVDPDFRGNLLSPYRDRLAAARRMFEDLQRQSQAQHLSDLRGIVVRVTGVGFFDMNHFQVGQSRSCVELHPILAIERVSAQ